ncbi:MAG: DUF4340 domain-containing protein [Clostridia bacterium]|nr:DUF4340 domain-containing protein [Clostridia bacterium]
MADFPEKENKGTTEEFSTIFSDPTAHNDTNVKTKKLLPKILAGVLALCVLIGGTVAVVKLIPVLDDGSGNSSTDSASITVKKAKKENVQTVTLLKGEEKIELFSETEDDVLNWYTRQVSKELTDSATIEAVVKALTDISAKREITQKTAEECGLTAPTVKATVTLKEGESYTVNLGQKSPDNSGYYLKLDGGDKIYLVDESVNTSLQVELLDFANTDSIAGFGAELEVFNTLTISGKNFPQTLKIEENKDNSISEYFRYLVTSPQRRLAKGIENVLPLYQNGILVAGAYSYDVSAASLQKFGLDNPDLTTVMTADGKTITYKFALQEDGDYAVVGDDSKLIHRVAASNIGVFVSCTPVDFYENMLFTVNIDNISKFTFETKDKSYSFDISKNDEEDEEKYTVIYNGKKLKSSNFQNFYAECISITTQDHTTENITPTADIAFRLKNKDGNDINVIFTKVNATRYQATLDGIDMGKVTASALDNIAKLVEKLINGETIE